MSKPTPERSFEHEQWRTRERKLQKIKSPEEWEKRKLIIKKQVEERERLSKIK
jgi:hypothetical protein